VETPVDKEKSPPSEPRALNKKLQPVFIEDIDAWKKTVGRSAGVPRTKTLEEFAAVAGL
jgi:hypothetical protein